jgi:hypothetical protein
MNTVKTRSHMSSVGLFKATSTGPVSCIRRECYTTRRYQSQSCKSNPMHQRGDPHLDLIIHRRRLVLPNTSVTCPSSTTITPRSSSQGPAHSPPSGLTTINISLVPLSHLRFPDDSCEIAGRGAFSPSPRAFLTWATVSWLRFFGSE